MRLLLLACLLCLTAAAPPGATIGEHYVRTEDGVQLWYRVAGQENGLPVLFLHGGPGEGSQAMQALGGPDLEKHLRMVYLDQRGSGRSERPSAEGKYSLKLIEADIDLVQRELGAEKIVLLAHSAGTPMALEYAADHPEHVAGLILTGAVPDMPAAVDALCDRVRLKRPETYAKALAAKAQGQKCDPFAAFDGELKQSFFDENMFPNRSVRERVNWLDHIPSLANTGQLGNALFGQGLMRYRFDRPDKIKMPLLFIAGGKDFQTAIAPQRVLAAKVRSGAVLVYPQAGHFMFADDPARFARDVGRFVSRLSR